MSKTKTTQTSESIEAFVAALDPKKQEDTLELIRLVSEATGLQPRVWGNSGIGFGNYHYKYPSGHEGDAPLVGFAPRKTAISLYLCQDFPEKQELLKVLGKHKAAVGCIYINKLADVDKAVLRKMIIASSKHLKKLYPEQ